MIYLASDHAGFPMKEEVKKYLTELGEKFEDIGCDSEESCDYTDFAHAAAEKAAENPDSRIIALCGNGIGISMVLNRHTGVRAARCVTPDDAKMTRRHNDANAIALGSRITDFVIVKEIIKNFLKTKFEGGRHETRVRKIEINK